MDAQSIIDTGWKKVAERRKQQAADGLAYEAAHPQNTPQDSPLASDPQVTLATTEALQGGANPLSLALAKKQLGKNEYVGYCQQFVRTVTNGATFPSAIAAWQGQQDKAVSGLDGVQPGDAVYFSPNESNSNYGHTGIYAGDNQFISATDNGIQQEDLGSWQKQTGQQVLGYIPEGQKQ